MNTLKQFCEIFRFHGDIRENCVSAYYCTTRTRCPRSTVLRGHRVEYADTGTKLWSSLIAFKGTIKQKILYTFISITKTNNISLKLKGYFEKKFGVRVVQYYADTRFLHFAIEYLREIEIVFEKTLACVSGA